ncbi:hypothetical protein D3C73_818610 [compost metagenome]
MAARHAGDVVEVARRKIVGVHGVHLAGQAGGKARDLVLADVGAERPIAAQARDGRAIQPFDAVAQQALLVPLQQRARTQHQAVVGVEAIAFQVAEVAVRAVVVQRVLQRQVRPRAPFGHGSRPQHRLLVQAVVDVVVLEARAIHDVAFALHHAVGIGLQRRAPVGAVDLFALEFKREGLGHVGAQVRQQGRGHLGGAAMVAVDPAVAGTGVGVDAQVVALPAGIARQLLVQADGVLAAVEGTQAELGVIEGVAFGQLGHVVDGAAHRARAEQKGGGAADGFDAVVDPAIDGAPGDGVVLHGNAVEQLRHLAARKSAIADRAGIARGRGVIHAGDAARNLLRVQGTARFDLLARDHGDAGRRFAQGQAQAAAGIVVGVQVDHAIGRGCGVARTVDGGGRQGLHGGFGGQGQGGTAGDGAQQQGVESRVFHVGGRQASKRASASSAPLAISGARRVARV